MGLSKIQYCIITLVIFTLVMGCKQGENSRCDLPFNIPDETKFIGHKGSGPIGQHSNPDWHENGKPSVLNALKKTDGTEVDIQMSTDSTLWLFHDHVITSCSDKLVNISSLSDSNIRAINACNFNKQLISLDEFNTLLEQLNLNSKHISLDLKVLSNPELLNTWKEDALVSYVFEQIQQTLKAKSVVIEIPQNVSYKHAVANSKLEIYQVFYDKKLIQKRGVEHISVPFNVFTELNSTYKKSQLWTPNKLSDMIAAMQENPDYIQSDNIPLTSFITQLRNEKSINCLPPVMVKTNGIDDEYINLIRDRPMPEENSIFHLDLGGSGRTGEQLFVLSIQNEKGENVYWESVNLVNEHPYLFLNHTISKGEKATYSVYIWNKLKTPVTLSGKLKIYQK